MSCSVRCLHRFNYTVTRVMLQLNFVGFAPANLLEESSAPAKRRTRVCCQQQVLPQIWVVPRQMEDLDLWLDGSYDGAGVLASNSVRTRMIMGLSAIARAQAQAHCPRSN